MKTPTYTARFLDREKETIFSNQTPGNLYGKLPDACYPFDMPGRINTFERTDGGDAWEYNVFRTPNGRLLSVSRDVEEVPLKIVVIVDADNGEVKVVSNVANLDVVLLNSSDPDPESTDAAEAKLAEAGLHDVGSINLLDAPL